MIDCKEFERMELLQLQASLCEKFEVLLPITARHQQYSTVNLESNCTMVILLLLPESRNKSIYDNITIILWPESMKN